MKTRSHFLFAAALLAACQPLPPENEKPVETLEPAEDFRPVSGEASTDDIARFLAGRPVRRGEALSRYQRLNGDYHTHALEFDHLWRRIGSKRTLRQAQYFHQDLMPLVGSPDTVVYPFGGPDILHAASMFPLASTYVLLGLEPVGSVPDPAASDPADLLRRVAAVMEEPIRHGYFITEEMRRAPAATPVMLASLALLDADITGVRGMEAAGRPGVEIRFRHPRTGAKRLVYVRADLSDAGFDAGLRAWLDRHRGAAGYFKAASYLAHDDNFSQIRGWVLGNCRAIVQDDSGIPFRYYEDRNWNVTLLGDYDRPIPLFSEWRQPGLAAAYDALPGGRGPEVPFGSGYHIRIEDANLQVAVRR